MAPQIVEPLADRASIVPTSSETANVAPDNSMASNLDLDGREQSGPSNPAALLLEKKIDTVEISTSRKRKMVDRSDTNVPADDEGINLKRNCITIVEEENSDSDIEFIGILWRPSNLKAPTQKKIYKYM